jgi:hypothetical protein
MSSQQQAAAQQELLNHLRSTMVRNEVGKVRRCVVQLPQDRIYGLPVYNDPENAGEITSSWKGPILSKPTSSDRSFVEVIQNLDAFAINILQTNSFKLLLDQ